MRRQTASVTVESKLDKLEAGNGLGRKGKDDKDKNDSNSNSNNIIVNDAVVEALSVPNINVDSVGDNSDKEDHFLFGKDQGIRGGNAIGALPWYAVFQSNTLCGASLIWGDILLTASHCVDDNVSAVRSITNWWKVHTEMKKA